MRDRYVEIQLHVYSIQFSYSNYDYTRNLCLGQTEIDSKISIINMTDVTEIYWEPFIYQDCAANIITTIVYNVTVTTPGGEQEGSVTLSGETSALITDLLPNQEYIVSVEASIVNGDNTCYIGKYQQSVVLNSDTDDPSLDEDSKHSDLLSVQY